MKTQRRDKHSPWMGSEKRFIAVVVVQQPHSSSADCSGGTAFCSAAKLTHRAVNHSTISVCSAANAGTQNHPDSSWKCPCFSTRSKPDLVCFVSFLFFLSLYNVVFFRRIWFKACLKLQHLFMLSLLWTNLHKMLIFIYFFLWMMAVCRLMNVV